MNNKEKIFFSKEKDQSANISNERDLLIQRIKGVLKLRDMDIKNIVISVHIPKTAGSTFAGVLSEELGNKILFVYTADNGNGYYVSKTFADIDRLRKTEEVVDMEKILSIVKENKIRCIHGHVNLSQMENLFKGEGFNVYVMAFVRDPIQRAYSELCHKKIYDLDKRSDIDILESTGNNISSFIGGYSLLNNICFFHTENFEDAMGSLSLSWGGFMRNVNKKNSNIEFNKSLLEKYNSKDIEIYERILNFFPRHAKKKNSGSIAISAFGVYKSFKIPLDKIDSLRGLFISIFKKKTFEKFFALSDVSFEINRGEFFGIVGSNGSGKSTLLKILSGVYTPNLGGISIKGAVSPFLELGIGFNPELSGRDNIYLNATVLGLTKDQVDKKFDQIVDFSELGRFIDQKIKNYSSGMQVRLAFSVSIHANREILLMDEVLAVGDASFQAKCMKEFYRYKKEGKTVVLVSHNLSVIEQYCDRALFLDSGEVIAIGDAREVVQKYRNKTAEKFAITQAKESVKPRSDQSLAEEIISKKVEIKRVTFYDGENNKRHLFTTGSDLVVRVKFDDRLSRDEDLNFGVAIFSEKNTYILGVNTILDKVDCRKSRDNGYFEISYKNIPLKNGSYYVSVGLFGEDDSIVYDFMNQSSFFEVISPDQNHGMVDIGYSWIV